MRVIEFLLVLVTTLSVANTLGDFQSTKYDLLLLSLVALITSYILWLEEK